MLETVRSYRILGFAIFDLVLAFAGMMLLAYWTKFDMLSALLLTLPVGVLVHWAVGSDTPLNQMVLGTGNMVAKFVVGLLLVLGVLNLVYV